MAVDLPTLLEYLETEGLEYAVARTGDLIFLPIGSLTMRIHVCEDGRGLVFHIPELFNIRDCQRREACLVFITNHNYTVKMGVFGYDPSDGEVDLVDFIPIEDGSLTQQQFMRMVTTMADVARTETERLRQVAYGQLDPLTEPRQGAEKGDNSGEAEPALPPFRAADVPAPPLSEPDWLRAVLTAFRSLCQDLDDHGLLAAMRDQVWPKLRDVRTESETEPFQVSALARELHLSDQDEFLALYLLAQQADGRARVTATALDRLAGEQDDEPAWRRLLVSGVAVACDLDGRPPLRLSHAYLDPLTTVLPFDHRPLPAAFELNDVPTGPVDESRWLGIVRQALTADATDLAVVERVTLLRDEVWPALLGLRSRSADSGVEFTTAGRAQLLELDPTEELLTAYLAAQADQGDARVELARLEQLVPPDCDFGCTALLLQRLCDRRLIRSADGDGRAPYTVGPDARPWQLATG